MALNAFSWTGRRVFVTGATGFVGRWLVERLLHEGAEVTALVRPDSSESDRPPDGVAVAHGRIEDAGAVARAVSAARPDSVFHLAANNDNLSKEGSPLPIFEANIIGSWSILEACRVTGGVELIVCASSSEVGATQASLSSRDGPRPRRHPYPVSKLSAELIALAFHDTYGLPVMIARSENVYGGRDRNWNRLIPGAARSVLRGKAPTLRSDGTLLRAYLYVEDVVDAYLRLASHVRTPEAVGQIFHFSTPTRASALEITSYLCELAGLTTNISVTPSGAATERVTGHVSGAREKELLGWEARTELREGLQWTLDWYREHPEFMSDGV